MLTKKPKKPLKVILDSSFLFIPSQFNLDIFEELAKLLNRRYESVVLSTTYQELQRLGEKESPKSSRQAALALRFAEKSSRLEVEKSSKESNDDVIVRIASENRWCVATNDRGLRKRLRLLNLPVIYLRQKSHLAMEGAI